MLFLRRTLPLIVALTFGLIGIAIYYIPHSGAQRMGRSCRCGCASSRPLLSFSDC